MKFPTICKTVLLLSLVIGGNACNDELNTVEGWKSIPVVYGLLSLNDTATYVRVEKAFVDPNRSATEIAQIPDSLYYKDINVSLVRVRSNERFALTQVDGNTEGYPRKEGIFAKSPNLLYKIKNSTLSLKADEEWRIDIQKKGETQPFAKSTTKIIGEYEVTTPGTTPVFLRYDNTFNITVQTDEKSARIVDVKIVVNYEEVDPTKPNQVLTKNIKWDFVTGGQRKLNGNIPDPIVSFSRRGRDFYEYLGNNLPVLPGVRRTFKSIDIEVLTGGQELIDYINIGIANTGITGSQTIPTFTNVQGGLGIFSARSKTVKTGVRLSDFALDLLINGEFTKKLNFKN